MSISLGLALISVAGFADLDGIDRQVAAFTGAPAGQPGGAASRVDRRLRLNPCAAPLSLTWRTPRRESVVVQCTDAGGWRLFVPITAAAAGMAIVPVVNRGDALTIAVNGDGFSVSQPGEAMESGAVGSWIRVRTLKATAKPGTDMMRAQVIRPGLVTVPLD